MTDDSGASSEQQADVPAIFRVSSGIAPCSPDSVARGRQVGGRVVRPQHGTQRLPSAALLPHKHAAHDAGHSLVRARGLTAGAMATSTSW
jgi:hypothetical protein